MNVSSLSLPEIWSWLAAQLMLSLLEWGIGISFVVMRVGGDFERPVEFVVLIVVLPIITNQKKQDTLVTKKVGRRE